MARPGLVRCLLLSTAVCANANPSESHMVHLRHGESITKEERPTIVVDLRDTFLPQTMKIAAQACAGLYNREEEESASKDSSKKVLPQIYTILADQDVSWLEELGIEPNRHWWKPSTMMGGFDFVAQCLTDFPRYVRYRYYGPARRVVPNVLTVAAVLDAVPLVDGEYVFDRVPASTLTKSFDAVTHAQFVDGDARAATEFVYDTYAPQTSTMAKLNPGYDTSIKPSKENEYEPPLVGDLDVSLIDFVFSSRLFAFYLYYGCIKWYFPSYHHDSYKLLQRMSAESASFWPSPIPVYGYDDSWNTMGGDFYEAETMCVGSHNLGQIATEGVSNLSFLGRMLPTVKPGEIDIIPNYAAKDFMLASDQTEDDDGRILKEDAVVYDKNKTYVALVIGDGDNVAYIKSSRANWMKDRIEHCETMFHHSNGKCFPVTWTISPHLANVAPDLLRWYVKHVTASKTYSDTSLDTFILPPSGHLYAYPGMMPSDVQEQFVTETELDAMVLNTTGIVDWEWFTDWRSTELNYYPKFTNRGIVRGIFTVNVPYLIPTGRFLPHEYFKIIEPRGMEEQDMTTTSTSTSTPVMIPKPVVMFRPREWRGTRALPSLPIGAKKDYLTPQHMAEEFGSYPRGTVTYLYMTSDGGLNYNDIAALANAIPDHVELVNTELATALALASQGLEQ